MLTKEENWLRYVNYAVVYKFPGLTLHTPMAMGPSLVQWSSCTAARFFPRLEACTVSSVLGEKTEALMQKSWCHKNSHMTT